MFFKSVNQPMVYLIVNLLYTAFTCFTVGFCAVKQVVNITQNLLTVYIKYGKSKFSSLASSMKCVSTP